MRAGCSPQSELGVGLRDWLPLTGLHPIVLRIVGPVYPKQIRAILTCRRPLLPLV